MNQREKNEELLRIKQERVDMWEHYGRYEEVTV